MPVPSSAVIKARKLYWLVPLYFFSAWLSGELALIHLIWQVALTALLAFTGGLADPLAQAGLGVFALSWLGLVYLHCQSMDTPRYLGSALRRALGQDYRSEIPVERQQVLADDIIARHWLQPFRFKREGVRRHSHISYGDAGKRNLLDIYHPQEPREGGFPVLLQVHGGAWMIGEKEQQALPLMYHMAQRGWLCVAINYRLSPKAAFPGPYHRCEKGHRLDQGTYRGVRRQPGFYRHYRWLCRRSPERPGGADPQPWGVAARVLSRRTPRCRRRCRFMACTTFSTVTISAPRCPWSRWLPTG